MKKTRFYAKKIKILAKLWCLATKTCVLFVKAFIVYKLDGELAALERYALKTLDYIRKAEELFMNYEGDLESNMKLYSFLHDVEDELVTELIW